MIEKQGFEIEEFRQIGNRSGERVVLETEDAELVKVSQSIGSEKSGEIYAWKDETLYFLARGALDSWPLTEEEG